MVAETFLHSRRSDMFIDEESLRSRHSFRSAMFRTGDISLVAERRLIKPFFTINIALLRSEDNCLLSTRKLLA